MSCAVQPALGKGRLKKFCPALLTVIAICDRVIANCDRDDAGKAAYRSEAMKLGEKIRYLREVEGSLRGLDRAMSQLELVRAIETETGSKLSQSYLSQIENGARPHLTNTTRQILAGFFKVHPGYLVDDPEGYSPELQSELRHLEDKLDLWLISGAERFGRDPELKQALLTLARNEHSRECLLLLEAILETPGLAPRLAEVLRKQGTREQGNKGAGREQGNKGTRDRNDGRGRKEGAHK
jgi:transcriptional regulator with XRE-family HTH domain